MLKTVMLKTDSTGDFEYSNYYFYILKSLYYCVYLVHKSYFDILQAMKAGLRA